MSTEKKQPQEIAALSEEPTIGEANVCGVLKGFPETHTHKKERELELA